MTWQITCIKLTKVGNKVGASVGLEVGLLVVRSLSLGDALGLKVGD